MRGAESVQRSSTVANARRASRTLNPMVQSARSAVSASHPRWRVTGLSDP
jgi:hypothetical protein